jgi:hypothetical protein
LLLWSVPSRDEKGSNLNVGDLATRCSPNCAISSPIASIADRSLYADAAETLTAGEFWKLTEDCAGEIAHFIEFAPSKIRDTLKLCVGKNDVCKLRRRVATLP